MCLLYAKKTKHICDIHTTKRAINIFTVEKKRDKENYSEILRKNVTR